MRTINLNNTPVEYSIRINKRLRHIRISIGLKDGCVVSIPSRWHGQFINKLLVEKSTWILKQIKKVTHQKNKIVLSSTIEEYEKHKHVFLYNITQRVKFFNSLYNFSYNKISIRNQTSLWGSCTHSGNLQFNFKLRYVPQTLVDYVVVHELCHLKEHNHSKQFWSLVSKTIPAYKQIRKQLNQYMLKEV